MKNFFWNIFVKSGSVEAFLGYKECLAAAKRHEKENTPPTEGEVRQL